MRVANASLQQAHLGSRYIFLVFSVASMALFFWVMVDKHVKEGAGMVYCCAKQRSEPTSEKCGAKVDELHLTPQKLIDRMAALVPPPRTHRHRYFGVLAPNSPLRAKVTAMAQAQLTQPAASHADPATTGEGAPGVAALGQAIPPRPEPVPPRRSKAR